MLIRELFIFMFFLANARATVSSATEPLRNASDTDPVPKPSDKVPINFVLTDSR